MNILFWNLGRKDNTDYVKEGLIENDVDLAVFCEHSETDFAKVISQITSKKYIAVFPDNEERVQILIKDNLNYHKVHCYNRYVTFTLTTSMKTYSITGVHLPDRRDSDTAYRNKIIRSLMRDINKYEDQYGISNTIIIGDFNANFYDDELLQFDTFNAVFFKDVIKQSKNRVIDNYRYRKMYNPILNYLSEKDNMVGSYYSTHASNTSYWYCLDQILLGPSLMDSVTKVEYLRKIGTETLICKTRPNGRKISDHLPLFVVIKES